MGQPNFIFFITDQQRYDHVGYAGNSVLKTPHIDSLANSGTWFSHCYVSSPTCMSSRATLMTGRMPSINGVRFNGIPLDLDSVTFVDVLRDAGYRTALIGKSHLQGMLEAPSMAPKAEHDPHLTEPAEPLREARRTHHELSAYQNEMQEVWQRTPDMAAKVRTPYYGFDHVEFCLGHSDLVAGHYNDWLREKEGRDIARGLQNAAKTSEVDAPQVYKPQLEEAVYPTRYIEERTIDYLKGHAADRPDKPFFIQCSFPDPHHPFTPPGKYYDMYDPASVDLPESFSNPSKDAIPPVSLLWKEYESGAESKRWTFPFVTGESETRDIVAKTYGQISMIDDAIGRILQTLDEQGLREDTVICFLSDHGDYLGDHGLMLKGPMQYQSVIRVPFVWNDPKPEYQQGHSSSIVSITDLATSVLQRAGIAPYNGVQGVNLCEALEVPDRYADRSVLIECTTQYPYLGFDGLVSVTSLVDKNWRLSVWQGEEWGELYDLANDPAERINLWDSKPHEAEKMRLMHALVKLMQDHIETSPYPQSVS